MAWYCKAIQYEMEKVIVCMCVSVCMLFIYRWKGKCVCVCVLLYINFCKQSVTNFLPNNPKKKKTNCVNVITIGNECATKWIWHMEFELRVDARMWTEFMATPRSTYWHLPTQCTPHISVPNHFFQTNVLPWTIWIYFTRQENKLIQLP